MNKLTSSVIAICLATLAVAANAEEVSDRSWYVSPFGSFLHPGGDRQGLNGWGAGMAVGKVINQQFNMELRGFWQNYQHKGDFFPGQTDLMGGTLDVQYYLLRDTFSPYLVAGVGGMHTSAKYPALDAKYRESSFIFETGLGTTYGLAEHFLLRADVRYRLDTMPGSADSVTKQVFFANKNVLNDLVLNLGFVIPF